MAIGLRVSGKSHPWDFPVCPATNAAKANAGNQAGNKMVMDLLRRDVTPSKSSPKPRSRNAHRGCVAATGGSTNSVAATLLAIANEAKLSLSIDDFDRISSRVPISRGFLKPGGRFVATDLYAAGRHCGWSQRRLLEAGLLRGDCLNRLPDATLAERRQPRPKEAPGAGKLCAKTRLRRLKADRRASSILKGKSRSGRLRYKSSRP